MMKFYSEFRVWAIEEILFFVLGLVSTAQLLQLKGITVFTWVLFATAAYYALNRNLVKPDILTVLFLVLSSVSIFLIPLLDVNNSSMWAAGIIKKSIILFALMFVYNAFKYYGKRVFDSFLIGIKISAYLQIAWCYIQLLFIKTRGININSLVVENYETQVNTKGAVVVTGMNTNAGILAPVLLIAFCLSDSILVRMAILLLFFVAGSSTLMVCGMVLVFAVAIKFLWIKVFSRKSLDSQKIVVVLLMAATVGVMAILIVIRNANILNRVLEIFNTLILRLSNVVSNTYSDGSTLAHARYYTSFGQIINETAIYRTLFGYGNGASGIPFVIFFHQYSSQVWVLESDPMNYIYSFGIISTVVFYIILLKSTWRLIRENSIFTLFMFTILVGGIFYGMQLNWVILLELLWGYGFTSLNNTDERK